MSKRPAQLNGKLILYCRGVLCLSLASMALPCGNAAQMAGFDRPVSLAFNGDFGMFSVLFLLPIGVFICFLFIRNLIIRKILYILSCIMLMLLDAGAINATIKGFEIAVDLYFAILAIVDSAGIVSALILLFMENQLVVAAPREVKEQSHDESEDWPKHWDEIKK